MKIAVQKTMNVQAPARAHDTDAVVRHYTSYPRRAAGLTVGQLMGHLQDAAWRYGSDTPVAVLTDGGGDYEQADALSVINTVKSGHVGGGDQYRADPDGTPMAVIA